MTFLFQLHDIYFSVSLTFQSQRCTNVIVVMETSLCSNLKCTIVLKKKCIYHCCQWKYTVNTEPKPKSNQISLFIWSSFDHLHTSLQITSLHVTLQTHWSFISQCDEHVITSWCVFISAVANSSDGESPAAADSSEILEEAVLFCSTAAVLKITVNRLRREEVKQNQIARV